jgi:hypothetical protein
MHVPINLHQIQVSYGMAQLYQCFIKKIAFITVPITKLTWKIKPFRVKTHYSDSLWGSFGSSIIVHII